MHQKRYSSVLFTVFLTLFLTLGVTAAPRGDTPRDSVTRIVKLIKRFVTVVTGGEISVPKP